MKPTERNRNAHGYNSRSSIYYKRASSIDGVVSLMDGGASQGKTERLDYVEQKVQQLPVHEAAAELDFPIEEMLQANPAKSLTFKPSKERPKKHKPVFRPKRHHVASGVAVAVVLILGVSSFLVFSTRRRQAAAVLAASVTQSELSAKSSSLEEIPPNENDLTSYNVEPGLPRMLRISQLGIEAPVHRVGVKPNGDLNPTHSIYEGAWYEGSGSPGDGRPVLIAGHVHGPTKPGIFYNLNKLGPGSQLELERGDGRIFRYKVVKTKEYTTPLMNLKEVVKGVAEDKPGLNLVTFSDIGDNGGYSQNCFLVIAEAIY